MMIFKKSLARRSFLRGVGTALALPMLDSMAPALSAARNTAAKPTARMAFIYGPNGRIMKNWVPKTVGAGFEMTRTLEPLSPFKERMLVLSGLNIKAADAVGNEPGGVHARPCAAFLTGLHPKPGGEMGISVDQFAAKEFSKYTQLASLELSMDSADVLGANDGAYSDAYTKTISWRSSTTPLPTEDNPRRVFERLIGEGGSTDPVERARRIERKNSILDFLTDDLSRLKSGIGASDRVKLNEYLESLRDIERRIQLAEEQSSRVLPDMEIPVGVPDTYSEHAKLMLDMQLLAFQGDLTRVITFMWGREQSDRSVYREIGVADGHHSLSHHSGNDDSIHSCAEIDLFHSQLFAYFLEKLEKAQDGEGSLLDHSIIVYASSLSDGNAHLHNDVPALLVGGGVKSKFKGGRHIRYDGLPLSNLHLTVLEMAGLPNLEGFVDREYSDTTGALELLSM